MKIGFLNNSIELVMF